MKGVIPLTDPTRQVLDTAPLCFWRFDGAGDGVPSLGTAPYTLRAQGEPPRAAEGGPFGGKCAELGEGSWYAIPRAECPALDFSGERSSFTLAAWLLRNPKAHKECQAVAGMWNETRRQRQYAMFLDLWIWDSGEQAAAHVSATGGPTEGYPYCMDAAIGRAPVPLNAWQAVAITYDGGAARVYLNGALDVRPGRNPFPYGKTLFQAGPGGADFTVGAVHRGGEMGNWFHGLLGGLAVYDRALTGAEIAALPKF